MALPEPQPGLVISYAYLWRHEHGAGREEGAKDRPCVVVLAVERPTDGATLVRVVPVTHRLRTTRPSLSSFPNRSSVISASTTSAPG